MEFMHPRSRSGSIASNSGSRSSHVLASGVAAASGSKGAVAKIVDLTMNNDSNSLVVVEESSEDDESSSSIEELGGFGNKGKEFPRPLSKLEVPPLYEVHAPAPVPASAPASAPAPVPHIRLRSASELTKSGKDIDIDCFIGGVNKINYVRSREEKFRDRMWPPRALISFSRIITRCRPPDVTPGRPLSAPNASGHAENAVSLASQWANDDLCAIPVSFDNPLMHAAVYFPLVVEESRESSLHSGYGVTGPGPGEGAKHDGYETHPCPPSWSTNGWLDAEVVSVLQESDGVGATSAVRTSRGVGRGAVWTLRVVLSPLGTKNQASSAEKDTSSSLRRVEENDDPNNLKNLPFVSPADVFTGGDLLVMCGKNHSRPILGVVQGWDPDYETRYSESLQREWMASDGRDPVSASRDADGREIMNILITVSSPLTGLSDHDEDNDYQSNVSSVPLDLGSPSAVALRRAGQARTDSRTASGGWADAGSIHAGSVFSLCAIGSMTTSIRECQALISFRDVHPAFHRVILQAPSSADTSDAGQKKDTLDRLDDARPSTMPPKLWTKLVAEHNPSQMRAIRSICYGESQASSLVALSKSDNSHESNLGSFSLLQGPPGTGKTRTILALVATILAGAADKPAKKTTRIVPGEALRRGNQNTSSEFLDSWNKQMAKTAAGVSNKDANGGKLRALICAPSNTAVDEIVYRIKTQGVLGLDGNRRQNLNVVRIGRAGGRSGMLGIDPRSAPACKSRNDSHSGHTTDMLRVVDKCSLDSLVEEMRRRHASGAHLSSSSIGVGASMGAQWSAVDARKVVLREADVVCATLSGAGSQPLVEAIMKLPGFRFDAVIVDEAAQATEPSSLIPLKYNPRNVILVGDPAQLPATVFSKVAKQAGLGRSLFERLQQAGYPVIMLETQYRMHPHIADYPSREFYQGKLLTDQQLLSGGTPRARPYHDDASGRFRPFVLHDVSAGIEEQEGVSILNRVEAAYVCDLYGDLVKRYSDSNAVRNVGIIAPYRAQRSLLKQMFKQRFGSSVDVEISTVDGFQGREKDIVIFSAVRAPAGSRGDGVGSHGRAASGEESIGFLKEWQRLNVAMTRARHALWIVGHRGVLRKDEHCWGRLVRFLEERGWLYRAETGTPTPSFHPNHRSKSGRGRSYDRSRRQGDGISKGLRDRGKARYHDRDGERGDQRPRKFMRGGQK